MSDQTTIVAEATGGGGAIAIVRLSGPQAIEIADKVFVGRGNRTLSQSPGFTLHYGDIVDGNKHIDDVLISLFRAPKSYTGEDMIEISVHASSYIRSELMRLLIDAGATTAAPGEFTQRAFLNGKMDLSQAEAVADLIASSSTISHRMASDQMRGGYSADFANLRSKLVELTSLLELELDFSQEDVEFADRSQLESLMLAIRERIEQLTSTFKAGNALKNGVPTTIVGAPNVGKSTILNALLGENRAMVSDIAGTTRDTVEERTTIEGVEFRFIDTAGLHHTDDQLEKMGIERTLQSVIKATIVLLVVEADSPAEQITRQIADLQLKEHQKLIVALNKTDLISDRAAIEQTIDVLHSRGVACVALSSRYGEGLQTLQKLFVESLGEHIQNFNEANIVVSNARHYEALRAAHQALDQTLSGLSDGLPSDLLAQHLHDALYHIGTITGEVTTDEILGTIFSKFCIGK